MLLTSFMKFTQERGRPLCHSNDSSLANISYEKLLTTAQTHQHAYIFLPTRRIHPNKAEDQANLCAGIFLPPSPENVQFGQARKREAEREGEKN